MRISRRTSSGFVANSNEPHVKALLCSSLAIQAINKDEPTAISNLRQEIVIYDQMPESPATLNNSSSASMTLATLTGDSAAYERAGTLIAGRGPRTGQQPNADKRLCDASRPACATSSPIRST